MDEAYQLPRPVRAQLATLGLQGLKKEQVRQMLENKYWRGYMDGEHDMNHRSRGIQIGDGNQQFNQF